MSGLNNLRFISETKEKMNQKMKEVHSGLPQLEFFGFGSSLRSGALLFGWLWAGYGLYFAFMNFPLKHSPGMSIASFAEIDYEILTPIHWTDWIIDLIALTVALILLAGVNLKKAEWLIPYILGGILITIYLTLKLAWNLFIWLVAPSQLVYIKTWSLIIQTSIILLNMYSLLIVNSYYNVLKAAFTCVPLASSSSRQNLVERELQDNERANKRNGTVPHESQMDYHIQIRSNP